MFDLRRLQKHARFFAPEAGGAGGDVGDAGGEGDAGGGGVEGDGGNDSGLTYDAWHESLDEGVRSLLDTHVSGLKTALTSERDQRKALARQLRDATGKLEEGSEARKALDDLTSKFAAMEQRAQFYEDAGSPEIGCSSPRLAYRAATEGDYFDGRGNVNWTQLKESYPELFVRPRLAPANAGAGAGAGASTGGTSESGMNAFLRAASGRVT